METYIKGEEIKVAIDLEAEGFSMNDDDFTIEAKSGKTSVIGYKNPEQGSSLDLIIFKDVITVPPTEEGEEETLKEQWYAIIDTKNLAVGVVTLIATAMIKDTHANDGVRTSICSEQLCRLVEA